MPPVGAAVAGLAGLFAAGGPLGTIGGILVKIGAGFGLNYVADALRAKTSAEQLVEEQRPTGTKFKLAGGGKVPRSFILGRWATSGSLVYHGSYGDSGKVPNSKYVQVSALSDLPVSDLVGILVNGREVTYDPDGSQAGNGQSISQYEKGGKENFWVRFQDGTQGSADNYLTGKFETDDYVWDEDYVGEGVAYAMWTARWNEKFWASGGDINVTYVINGLKLYDVRKDTTAGGSGTHRWNDQSTWEFTRNPVVMIYNIMRGLSYDGEWVYGGQTIGAAQLPFASWAAAMNECDVEIDLKGGGTQPQFRAGGEIEFSSEPLDIIERLLMACNGRLADCGGVYNIHVGAAATPVYSFTDDDVIIDEEQAFDPFPGQDDTVNGIVASYVSPDSGWTEKNARARINEGYVDDDGGRRLVANLTYDFVSVKQQVQRLTKAALEEARRFRRHVIVLPPSAGALEPLDFVSWTSARNGYSSKVFRCDQIDIRPNLDVVAYLTEVDPADYDWEESTDELDEDDEGTFFTPPTVPAPTDWTATGVAIPGDGGVAIPGIRLTWDPDPDIDDDGAQSIVRIDFEVRLASTTALIYAGNTPFVSAGAIDISQNIASNTAYEVRGRYFSSVYDTTWTNWIPVTTPEINLLEQIEANFRYLRDTVFREEGSFLHETLNLIRDRLEEVALANAVDINETHHQRKIIAKVIAKETADRVAAVLLEATARVDGDTALAELVGLLEAQFNQSLAQAALEIQAVATDLDAQASLISTVAAVANGVSANGFMRLSAISAPSGVTARFAILLNVGTAGSPNYKQTGFFLDVTGTGVSAVSRAVFDVDQFYIGDVSNPAVPYALAFSVIGGQVYIRNAMIRNLVAENFAVGAVGTDQLANGAITDAKIISGAITAVKIADGAVVANKVAAGAITATKIATGAVTATKIAADSITGDKIAANAITAGKITAESITTAKIAGAAITKVYTDNGGSNNDTQNDLQDSVVNVVVPFTRGTIIGCLQGNLATSAIVVVEVWRTRNGEHTLIGADYLVHPGGGGASAISLSLTFTDHLPQTENSVSARYRIRCTGDGGISQVKFTLLWLQK